MDEIGPEIPVKKASSMYFNYNNISCESVAVRHLNILYPKLLCAKLELPQLKIACIYFHQFASIFPCKNHGPLFKHTWIFFTQLQEWFHQVQLELVQWLKRRFLMPAMHFHRFVNLIHLEFEDDVVLHWNKLNCQSPLIKIVLICWCQIWLKLDDLFKKRIWQCEKFTIR